ncbi:MAG: permease of drug/metabolite transporter superfamily [Symbiobacteriaceae bacterium]|nr:permease of drug/metabolite transporter superfamily [Symbiobacteriaceae bacterium]
MRIQAWMADLLLILVTAFWGATFPVVKNATDLGAGGVPTYWFLAARFTLAAVLLATFFWRKLAAAPLRTWAAGALVGLFLFSGYALQTFGLALTSSAKAGFITGLCVVLVPVLAVIWLKRKPQPQAWLGVGTATAGLALLSLNADLVPTYGDLLVFLCAVGFALHIAAVSRYAGPHDPTALAVIQIGTAAVLSWALHLLDKGTVTPGVSGVVWWGGPANVVMAWLVCGVLATAVAFLLQNVLQPYTTPTHTALIFSAEPVWGAIFSYILLGETLTLRGYIGAGLILAGMLLAEIPLGSKAPDVAPGD